MDDSQHTWSDSDSRLFVELGEIYTPSRGEQIDTIVSLIPAGENDRFAVVDVACGAGLLSRAILERFPGASVLALDGSAEMRREAGQNLSPFGRRVDIQGFDLLNEEWLQQIPDNPRCVVSSLAIHHVDGPAKHRLFQDVADHLEPGGALLIADLVEPVNQRAAQVYGDAWDAAVREQSLAQTGSLDAYGQFQDGWNHFRTPDTDVDTPSGLFEQLQWLAQAGFREVDCFWLRAGHAIYGGYR